MAVIPWVLFVLNKATSYILLSKMASVVCKLGSVKCWATSKSPSAAKYNPNPRLVVIDTLVRVRRPRGGSEGWYEYDYQSVEPLKALADRYRMAVVVVHHLNKQIGAVDPFDLISGSNGLAACADSTLILDRDGQGVRLYGRGRDVEEFEKALSFDKVSGRWSILGEASEVHRSDERKSIIDALARAAGP